MHAGRNPCKICGEGSRLLFALSNPYGEPTSLAILVCEDCDHIFVGNPPAEETLRASYEAVLDSESYYAETATRTSEKIACVVADLKPLFEKNQPGASLLDIGCGPGDLLVNLLAAFPTLRLEGHEIHSPSAQAAREKGLDVRGGELLALDGAFSFVTLVDVIEHVVDPVAILRECRRLLSETGSVYLHTPRRCFWDEFLLGLVRLPVLRRVALLWFGARLSVFHLHLWSDRSLRKALEQAGFRVVSFRARRELSWPVTTYLRARLGGRVPTMLVSVLSLAVTVLFVWLGTLRNKAICLAEVPRYNSAPNRRLGGASNL